MEALLAREDTWDLHDWGMRGFAKVWMGDGRPEGVVSGVLSDALAYGVVSRNGRIFLGRRCGYMHEVGMEEVVVVDEYGNLGEVHDVVARVVETSAVRLSWNISDTQARMMLERTIVHMLGIQKEDLLKDVDGVGRALCLPDDVLHATERNPLQRRRR